MFISIHRYTEAGCSTLFLSDGTGWGRGRQCETASDSTSRLVIIPQLDSSTYVLYEKYDFFNYVFLSGGMQISVI